VVGGGVIAWWAVVFLKKSDPKLNVTLLHNPVEDAFVETPEPDFSYLLKLIGLSSQDLIKYADGNYCCAQAYFDWALDVENYFHSADVSDLDYDITPYSQWLLKLKLAKGDVKADDYLLASSAARVGKVTFAENQKIFSAGLSFDADSFIQLLMSCAQALNVNVLNDELEQVCLTAAGEVESLLTVTNANITGDFFIDVTGGDSKLLGSGLHIEYDSWAQYLPCNRKKYLKSKPRTERLIPFSAAQLSSLGWVKNRPLRTQLVAEFIYHDDLAYVGSQDATLELFSNSKAYTFFPGARKKTWHKNCLALGEAAVTFDYFSHSSLYVAAVSLQRFIEFWPNSTGINFMESEFNRVMATEFQAIRDFHCLHYVLAKKADTPFGELLKEVKLPESLRYRMELFGACGGSPADESTLIHAAQWSNLFLGFSFWPKTYSGMLSHVAIADLELWSNKIKTNIKSTIENSPDYTRYMARLISAR
ncbi:MAG TPA: tryptophan 7-halogenase, partial [Cellvibrio sp.]|nr:tryptophan 7-halogenase [Cellvibrio sp.]